jgi:hypothetical protein
MPTITRLYRIWCRLVHIKDWTYRSTQAGLLASGPGTRVHLTCPRCAEMWTFRVRIVVPAPVGKTPIGVR